MRAVGWHRAVTMAARYGFLIPKDEIPTPAHDELARREKEDPSTRGSYASTAALEIRYEALTLRLSEQAERAIPNAEKARDAVIAERQEQARLANIERRASEIAEEKRMKEIEKVRQQARKEAEAEIGK